MTIRDSSTLPALVLAALLATACGGPGAAHPSASHDAPADGTDAPAAAGPGVRDPKIAALAKDALACKFEEGSFDDECPGFKAWTDNEELFEEGKGDDTVLSMLGDGDVKVRILATKKGFTSTETFFADKAHGKRLFELAAKEKDDDVASSLASYVTRFDAEAAGFGAELRASAKLPNARFRKQLGAVIAHYQGPAAVEVVQTLLQDEDKEVVKSTISDLSTGGITPGAPPVCKLLAQQIARTDDLVGPALWAGSSSKCVGMDKLVIDELRKRVNDPTKVTNAVGIDYALAAAGVCDRTKSDDLKKKGFEIGKKLTDTKIPDANTRRSAFDVLASCGPAGAAAAIRPFANDKDKFIADSAKRKLDQLSAKSAKKK